MMRNMRRGIPNILKEGVKFRSGLQEYVLKNLEACKQLSDITKTSYGPNGMNKMLVNHLEKIFVTSDTATILKELEVEHPAAKIMTMASNMQDWLILFVGELLGQAGKSTFKKSRSSSFLLSIPHPNPDPYT
jgi:T-complex protein 1 subunit theta